VLKGVDRIRNKRSGMSFPDLSADSTVLYDPRDSASCLLYPPLYAVCYSPKDRL
jgi:uncharacterized protein YfiM (DUF2279 family)